MEVAIDKLGRVLIPKKVRNLLGLAPGTSVQLVVANTGTLELIPTDHQKYSTWIATDEHGFPLIRSSNDRPMTIDINKHIKQTREEYLDRKLGWE